MANPWPLSAGSAATAPASPPPPTSKSRAKPPGPAREDPRETKKKEPRALIQPHPDVLILPPDPPQLLIKLGQIRTLIQRAHYLPSEAPRKIFILTAANMMKEAANSLLKILEEPPETVHIFILAENPGELLPTIRSRCANIRLGALPVAEIE